VDVSLYKQWLPLAQDEKIEARWSIDGTCLLKTEF
jgi:hypothetical protein